MINWTLKRNVRLGHAGICGERANKKRLVFRDIEMISKSKSLRGCEH